MIPLPVAGLTILASYLVGAIPFGYLVARWRGVDIFRQGSGNIGATNVGRVLGRRFGILVFLLDFAKGALPVAGATWIAHRFATEGGGFLEPEDLRVAAGLAAFLGHVFPIYLQFRGGKGVATGAGVVTMLVPGPALGAILTWIVVVSASRYISLASLLAALALCGLYFASTPEPFASDHRTLTVFCLVSAGLVVLRHRANMARLFRGTENRLGNSPTMLQFTKTIHVLALGLWFGSVVFFSFVVAPVVFHTFAELADPATSERAHLPLAPNFDLDNSKELAGVALRPIFPCFFLIQGVCALLAVSTSLTWSWSQPRNTVHKLRTLVLILAMATLVAAWPLVVQVNKIRADRYDPDPAIAAAAREAFPTWHLYSLSLDMATLALVTVGMALAAQLPPGTSIREIAVSNQGLAVGAGREEKAG